MRERGTAILIVIWCLALVSGLAVGAGSTARIETRIARNMILEAKARHAAEAGIYRAILTVMQPGIERVPETPLDAEMFGVKLRVRVRDECGKADLNTGAPDLVRRILAGAVAEDQAVPIADAILDWRDPDHSPRRFGAEDEIYRDLGVGHGARDGLFEAVDELQHVRGITPAAFARLRPLLTVDCLNAGIDPLKAPARVLAAIAGPHDRAAVDDLLRWREAATRRDAGTAPLAASAPPFDGHGLTESAPGDAFEITATATLPSGAAVVRQAVVFLTRDPERPFVLRDLRRMTIVEGNDRSVGLDMVNDRDIAVLSSR